MTKQEFVSLLNEPLRRNGLSVSHYPSDFIANDTSSALDEPSMFSWRVVDGQLIAECYTQINLGPISEALAALSIYDFTYHITGKDDKSKDIVAVRWHPNGKAEDLFYWREWYSAHEDSQAGPDTDIGKRHVQRKERDTARELTLLARLSSYTTRSLNPSYGWRGLAGNPVLHFQFGLGYAVATDGSRVLLLETLRLSQQPRWFLTHAKNIQGCATATPTPVRGEGKEKTIKKTDVDMAMELLNKLGVTL